MKYTLPAMEFADRAALGEPLPRYQVRTINSVGLLSPLSKPSR